MATRFLILTRGWRLKQKGRLSGGWGESGATITTVRFVVAGTSEEGREVRKLQLRWRRHEKRN